MVSLSKGERPVIFLVILSFCLAGCSTFPPAERPLAPDWKAVKEQIRRGEAVPLKAGTAKVEITPPVGTPTAGYGKRQGKSSAGIRDPLYVRAVSLSDGQDTVVILSADLLVFPQPVADRVLQRISDELKLPRQAVVLACTHTHSGSGGIGHGFLFEKVFGAYDPKVVEGITGRVAWAARQAVENSHPVRWGTAVDAAFLQGLVENRSIPGGPVDPALRVLFLESTEGLMQAVLVVAAAHPTLMDSKDLRFSADFPGEICRRVEEAYPGSVCLFLNGAAGDTRPRDAIGETADRRIERFGAALSEGVTGLVTRVPPRARGDLAAWGGALDLPPPQLRIGPIPIHPRIGRWMRPTRMFQNLVALDKILLVPLSAEMTAEVGIELKQRLSALGVEPVPVGYTGGYIGYAVTAQRYNSGSYEAWMTWYGPELGDFLIEQIRRLAGLYKEK